MVLAMIVLFIAVCQIKAQTLPATDGTYYYIQFKRGTNLVVESQGTGTSPANQIKTADLVFGKAEQLWKFVDAGNGAYYIVSKALDGSGNAVAISWNGSDRFIAATYPATSTPLYITSTGITSNTAYLPAFVIARSATDTKAMNPVGGSDVGRTIGEWNKDDDGDALVFRTAKDDFKTYIDATTVISSSASLNPGNRSSEVQNALKSAITAANTVYDNAQSTDGDYETAGNALRTALATYNAAPFTINPVISSADNTNEKWYFFQGTRPANTYMTTNGVGAGVASKTVIPDDTQLWKIVANPNSPGTGYALVNKANGGYLNADANNDTQITTIATMPARNIVFNLSNIYTNGVARFWVENAGTTSASTSGFTFRLHAGVTNVLNWSGNRYDNSSWLLMDYSISLKGFLKEAIASAQAVVNDAIPVGTALGQYPADAKPALSTAIAIAQAVYDNQAATDAEIKSAVTAINTATTICKGKRSDAVVSTAENPRWYVIRNLLRTDANSVKNHVITANGVVEDGVLLCRVLANNNDQLWRFEYSPTGGVKVINAARPTLGIDDSGYDVVQKLVSVNKASGYIIDILGSGYKLTSIAGNQLHEKDNGNLVSYNDVAGTASNWAIEERTSGLFLAQNLVFDAIPAKLTTDAAFNLTATTNASGSITYTSSNTAVATIAGNTVTIVGAGTSDITASNAGDATYAQASVKQTLTVSVYTGVHDAAENISVVVKDRKIVVTGTDAPFKVFTLAGSELDAKKVLTDGIYIVKVADKIFKLNVR